MKGTHMKFEKKRFDFNFPETIWNRYCGFLDLTLDEFMAIQKRKLLEQITLLERSPMKNIYFKNKVPQSVEEFRKTVSLTTYEDYLPYLDKEKTDGLPAEPVVWARSSGRSSIKQFKWVPYSKEMLAKVGEFAVASFILASCNSKGDVKLKEENTCLYSLAPPPYFTGAVVARGLTDHINIRFLPSFEESRELEFKDRVKLGFTHAFTEGIDFFYGLSSILVSVGEQFGNMEKGSGGFKPSIKMLKPSALGRIIKILFLKLFRKEALKPKDIWQVKGIVAGGMDTAFFKDKIEELWGRKPLEGYGGTEMGGIALQAWNRKGMSFLPDGNFLEFIPEEDFYKSRDEKIVPRLLTMDQLEKGVYEIVITNFNGGIFVRYRTGDLIEIIGKTDDELGIDLPQMVFHARADGVIDLGGFTRLTEKRVWGIINTLGIPYAEWSIRKEYTRGKPILHLYFEPINPVTEKELQSLVHKKLMEEDSGYEAMERLLDIFPLDVTILSPGTFSSYIAIQQAEGAELAHLKPPHFNARDEVVEKLIKLSHE